MLKKLRRKFILINMSLVSTVLLLLFASLMLSAYQQNAKDTIDAMVKALQQPRKESEDSLPQFGIKPKTEGPDAEHKIGNFTPTVTVTVDASGNTAVEASQLAIIPKDTLDVIIPLALECETNTGIFSDYDLRFMKEVKNDGSVQIVFADRSHELANLRHLILSSLLTGVLSLIALFLISLGLSRLAVRPVEKAWEQQRQFIADASHELKTPLTVILANTGILLGHPDDTIAQQQKWIQSTKEEGGRMKKLIDDLLFLAKNDADRLPSKLTRLELSDTLWSCLLPFEALAFERGITLDAHIDTNLFVLADSAHLKQLIHILLDNACKYSDPRGTITVTLKKQQNEACLSVHNMGKPIAAEALPHIFERFYRADTSRSRSENEYDKLSPSGYGLGLAIAKTIADQHHAKISVVSTEQAGTTFTVLLPLI